MVKIVVFDTCDDVDVPRKGRALIYVKGILSDLISQMSDVPQNTKKAIINEIMFAIFDFKHEKTKEYVTFKYDDDSSMPNLNLPMVLFTNKVPLAVKNDIIKSMKYFL